MATFEKIISKYQSAVSTKPSFVNLYNELDHIGNGTYKFEVLACRELYNKGDKIAYKKNKSILQAVTFSGKFSDSHKRDNLIEYSNFIIIDIDSIEEENVERIKKSLFQDKYVCAIWISPSGHGLKVLFKVDSTVEEHKKCFEVLLNYVETNYEVDIDKSGSDICRLCFVSFDENILIKESFLPFNFNDYYREDIIPTKETAKGQKEPRVFTPTQAISEKVIFKGTEGKNSQNDRNIIIKIIKFLKKNNTSITAGYSDWFRVACAIANSFTYDLGQRYYLELCRLDGDLHDEYKSQNLLEYCYRNRRIGEVEFSTIVYLAKQKGFIIK